MNTDIRIKTSFPNHPKTLKLIDLMGETAPWKFIKLLLFAGQNKPDGLLANMSRQAICTAMGHKGNPTLMINALKKCGFLDKHESGFLQIHDWKDHNPYAFRAPERTAHAKKGAAARWEKKTKQTDTTCSEHDRAMLRAQAGNAPAPSPVPSPSPIEGGTEQASIPMRRSGEIAFEKAEAAWTEFEAIVVKSSDDVRIVINDSLSQKIYFALGGRNKILELHGRNGDELKKEFLNRYMVLEIASFKSKSSGSG